MSKDWEAAYKLSETPWDKGEGAPPLREYLQDHNITGEICVPGCGVGHDVRLLGEQSGVKVCGLDLSPTAIERAKELGETESIRYEVADLFALNDRLVGQFDWVFEHTCLCAIDRESRPRYVEAVSRLLKSNGRYLAIFFKNVGDRDGGGPPFPIDDQEIELLFSKDFEVLGTLNPSQTYPSRPIGSEEVRWFRKRTG